MKNPVKIQDGAYTNFVTGMGNKEMDKSESTMASPFVASNIQELARMKMQDGIAACIVEHPVDTAFKEDISIIGDTDGKILKGAFEIGLVDAMIQAGEYIRLTGGAVVVQEFEGDDVNELSNEAPKNAKIKGYWVYSAGKIELERGDFVGNEPSILRIVGLDQKRMEVHPSRCVIFKGVKAPDVMDGLSLNEAFFGTPALKKCEKSLKDLSSIFASVVNMAMETGLAIFSLENFNEMLSKPDCGIEDAQKLMSLVKLSMNSMRAVFQGSNDKVELKSHNFAGIPEVLQKSINRVSGDSRIPASILFGQSASGLAQTNKGDLLAYGEMVEGWRKRYMYRPCCKLVGEFAARNFGRQDVSEFEWGSVTSMSLDEVLDAKKKQMEIAEKAINLGVITPDEARENLFLNGHSWNIVVEVDNK